MRVPQAAGTCWGWAGSAAPLPAQSCAGLLQVHIIHGQLHPSVPRRPGGRAWLAELQPQGQRSGTALHCSADSHSCSHSPPRPASCIQHFELGTHINQVNKRSALSACLGTFSSSLRSALVRLHHP